MSKAKGKTRAQNQKFFNKYFDVARENQVKLTYKQVSELNKDRGNKSFKSIFNQFLEHKLNNKEKYIRYYYNLDKPQAREVLNISLANDIPIHASYKVISGEITKSSEVKNWIEVVNWLMSSDNFKNPDRVKISFPEINWNGSLNEFLNERAIIREQVIDIAQKSGYKYGVIEYIIKLKFLELPDLLWGNNIKIEFTL